jgi:transcriptional regulator with XRE-family HTH domain
VGEGADLGQALRILRADKGLTAVELAQRVGVTQTAISRYEIGTRRPSPETLERIADALGASKRVKQKLVDQLHSEQTELQSIRAIARRGLRRRQEEIARIEAKTGHLRNFQAAVVPGLLQTPNYARKMFEEVGLDTRAQDVSRALAVRLDRQAILHDPDRRFGFVITEAVLLWPRGGIPEMLAQLDRLQAVSELPTVDLAILPLGISPPYSPINSFDIYDDKLVLIETLTEQLAVRDSSDLAMYVKAYEAFRESALSGPDARKLFESVAARLRRL